MANETTDKTLLQSIGKMLDTLPASSNGYDNLINILALLAILCVVNRSNQTSTGQVPSSNNLLQKLLGEVSKGDGSGGGPSPELLMSLLPLLNNPQVKSKLNSSNMSSIFGLLNNLGANGEKQESTKLETSEPKVDYKQKEPAAAGTTSPPETNSTETQSEVDNKNLGRYLNWKSSF